MFQVVKTHDLGNGYTAEKYVVGEAYARNGNADRPTRHFRYRLRLNGNVVDTFPLLRDCRRAVVAYRASEGKPLVEIL